MTLSSRPSIPDDLAAITDLQARYDIHWLGAPERDESEMAEELDHASACVVVESAGMLVAAAWNFGDSVSLTIAPGLPVTPPLEMLLPWLGEQRGHVGVLDRDDDLRAALTMRGWTHARSAFELLRPVSADWQLESPRWPDGIRVTTFSEATPAHVHDLIYRQSGFGEIVGHTDRDLQNWTSHFVTEKDPPDQQVLAWREEVVIGAALGRVFSDGAGWIAQLAVARSHRRQGLGKALLLEAFKRRIAAGATVLGLGVQAENAGAIALYTGIGLHVDREWQIFAPPR